MKLVKKLIFAFEKSLFSYWFTIQNIKENMWILPISILFVYLQGIILWVHTTQKYGDGIWTHDLMLVPPWIPTSLLNGLSHSFKIKCD